MGPQQQAQIQLIPNIFTRPDNVVSEGIKWTDLNFEMHLSYNFLSFQFLLFILKNGDSEMRRTLQTTFTALVTDYI